MFDNGIDNWANNESYQLISAGLDDLYGSTVIKNSHILDTLRLYPKGAAADPMLTNPIGYDLDGADDDNVTNFCKKSRLGDDKP